MKLISTLFAKNALALTLMMLVVSITNARIASPFGVQRVFWNKFDAVARIDGSILLTWNVTEYNNKSFHIQHSINGTDWENIAEVPSKNSVESMVDYSFSHANNLPGKQYYRIQESDVDIKATGHSPIRTLNLNKEHSAVIVWPNPVVTSVRIDNMEKLYTSAKVFDLNGRTMIEKKLGNNINTLDVANFPSGTFIVRLANEKGNEYSQKIVKQ